MHSTIHDIHTHNTLTYRSTCMIRVSGSGPHCSNAWCWQTLLLIAQWYSARFLLKCLYRQTGNGAPWDLYELYIDAVRLLFLFRSQKKWWISAHVTVFPTSHRLWSFHLLLTPDIVLQENADNASSIQQISSINVGYLSLFETLQKQALFHGKSNYANSLLWFQNEQQEDLWF